MLGVLAAVRVAIPLAALADSGHALPGLPHYAYGYRGDASGYYATARAILSGVPALGVWLAPILLAVAAGLWLARRERRRDRPVAALLVLVLVLALVASVVILAGDRGAVGAVGWPLLWAIPLAPLRVLGVISLRNAFGFGLALSLAANAGTVVAAGYAGFWSTGRRRVGILAAALWAFWPLYVGLVAGHVAWSNGTWEVDTGLALYTEPLSTFCATAGIALLLRPRRTATLDVLAGIVLGYATLTRPTNALLALLALAVVLGRRGLRPALAVASGGLATLPVWFAFLPKKQKYSFTTEGRGNAFSGISLDNVGRTFADSPLWGGRMLGALLPPALLGLRTVRGDAALLLCGWIVLNTAFYACSPITAYTPRYLFAALPAALVLWAAGASAALSWASSRLR